MALKAVLDRLEDAPEAARGFYIEKDGKFILDAEVPPGTTDAAMRALEHERKQRADAIRARDETATRVTTLESELAALRQQQATPPAGDQTKQEAERLKREYDDRIKAIENKLAKAEQKATDAETRLAETAIADALRSELVSYGLSSEAAEDLITLPKFRQPWKYHDGKPTVFDGDTVRLDPDKAGANMTAKSYVREYLKENKQWQPPSSGGGATGAQARLNGTAAHMITREQAQNVEQYRAAKAAAEKAGVPLQVTQD